jgi:hypothetical protein
VEGIVTTVSIRLALKQICHMTCETGPSVIPVVALGDAANRFFAVSIPSEYRQQVYSYLMERLAFAISMQDEPLMLSREQAEVLVQQILTGAKPAT